MELVELTRKLVGFDTSQGQSTRPMADFVSEYCEAAGFTVTQYPYEVAAVEMVNVVAMKGGEESALALSGHMDTVKTDHGEWRTDPHVLTQKGDKYYGLGVADMKLFLAIAMKAGETISAAELTNPFALYFTSNEEVGCLGARDLVHQEGFKIAPSVVIGEPTSLIPINHHKGYMYLTISLKDKTKGKNGDESRHSSDPRKVRNVVELGLPLVLAALNDIKQRLEAVEDINFDPPYPTMNVGVVTTGEEAAKNIIPKHCQIELDIRPVPDQDVEGLFSVVQRVVTRAVAKVKDIEVQVRYGRAPTPPMKTSAEAPIVKLASELGGHDPKSVCYNTEGGIFNLNGAQSVVWGPANKEQIHKPNEYADTSWFEQETVEKFITLIRQTCCGGE